MQTKQLNIRLTPSLFARLKTHADSLSTTPSQIVREAIVRELDRRSA